MNQNRNRNDPKVGLTSRKFVMLSFKEIARIAGNSRSLQECSESSYPPISKNEKRNEMLPNPGDRSRRVIASPSIWDLFFLCRRRTCSRTRSIARRRRWRSAATEIAKHRLKWDATETVFFSAVFFFAGVSWRKRRKRELRTIERCSIFRKSHAQWQGYFGSVAPRP